MFVFIAEKYGRLCQEKGKLDQALSAFQRLLESEPLADQVRIQYWQILKRLGRSNIIRRDYQAYAVMLKRE